MEKIQKVYNSILFLLRVGFIILSELLVYSIYRDYSIFIDRLTHKLASINILYVKIFQAFALNNSLINDKINNKLIEFTDNAPWNFSDLDLGILNEVADKYDIILKQGYEVPINSGMISVVFKGYKRCDNSPVIIKMKRKNIQEKLNESIENLLFTVYLLSFIPIMNKYQISEVIHKNIEIIRSQTDFLQEVDNMNLMKNNCKNLKYIVIPSANKNITEEYSNVIVMDYIQGVKLNNVKQEDYEGFAKQVIKFGIVTSLIHGTAHGDLHCGNILFIKDFKDEKYPFKLGIIDFGIIFNIESKYKEFLFDIITNIFETSSLESAKKILNSGIIEPIGILEKISKDDYDHILSFTEKIIFEAIYDGKKTNQIQIYKFLSKLKDYLCKKELMNLGIRPSDDFVKSQLVLAMAHGVTLKLCNDNFVPLMDKVMSELFNHILFTPLKI
jgi:predicted unusual protein kinase regulating ubiquinone biosynthesis (AarF/ABC1/UbiB family)